MDISKVENYLIKESTKFSREELIRIAKSIQCIESIW